MIRGSSCRSCGRSGRKPHRALAELVSHQPQWRSAVQIRADVRDGEGECVMTATLLIVSEFASEGMDGPSGD